MKVHFRHADCWAQLSTGQVAACAASPISLTAKAIATGFTGTDARGIDASGWNSMDQAQVIQRLQRDLEQKGHEIKSLKSQLLLAENEVRGAKLRLSEMASTKMREDNPCVEDLNDPLRPTALAAKWTSLFRCGEYWTAYEAIARVRGESDTAAVLYRICKIVYSGCAEFVDHVVSSICSRTETFASRAVNQYKDQLKTGIANSLEEIGWQLGTSEDKDSWDVLLSKLADVSQKTLEGQVPVLRKEYRRQVLLALKCRNPPQTVLKKILDAVQADFDDVPKENFYESFAVQLFDLCYRLRTQDIPLVVDFRADVGAQFDPCLFEVESSAVKDQLRQQIIKCVLRPPLLRSENGAVLCKGEVELEAPQDGCKLSLGLPPSPTKPEEGSDTGLQKSEAASEVDPCHASGRSASDAELCQGGDLLLTTCHSCPQPSTENTKGETTTTDGVAAMVENHELCANRSVTQNAHSGTARCAGATSGTSASSQALSSRGSVSQPKCAFLQNDTTQIQVKMYIVYDFESIFILLYGSKNSRSVASLA